MSTLKRLSLLSPLLSQIEEAVPQLSQPIDTEANKASCILAYQAWVTSTSDLLYNLGRSDDSVIMRLTKLVNKLICQLEPSLVLCCCKLAYDTILDFISKKISLTYSDFKDQISTITLDIKLTDAFLAPINFALSKVLSCESVIVNGVWKNTEVKYVKVLQQYFGFLTKLPISNIQLEDDALSSYIEMEDNYPPFDNKNVYLKPLRKIITEWLSSFSYDGSRCKHGKGAVSDAKAYQLDKYKNMRSDIRLEHLFKSTSFEGFHSTIPLPLKGKLDRCSKVVFVPKNVSKLRTISMEPTSLQYVQQGVMAELYDYIRDHNDLGNHVKLEDQTVNQGLAYDGSITNRYATIDLSHASDSVSYDLVRYLFGRNTKVLRWIVGTRSNETLLPNGSRISLKKFAPMGSALCFPIETIIFAAIAKLSTLLGHERGLTCDSTTGIYSDHYSVYGDDIIIPLPVYKITTDILESLSFEVNQEKSYCNSPFKESCGGNYFCGADITPLRWRCLLRSNGKISPDSFSSLCSSVNTCSDKNFRITRSFILSVLQSQKLKPLFTKDEGKSPLIYSTHCTNFHLKILKSKRYQKDQFSYDTITPIKVKCSAEDKQNIEDILYHQYLIKTQQSFKRAKVPTRESRYSRFCDNIQLTNNMHYSKVNRRLSIDVTQPLGSLSIMEKTVKFSRGLADV